MSERLAEHISKVSLATGVSYDEVEAFFISLGKDKELDKTRTDVAQTGAEAGDDDISAPHVHGPRKTLKGHIRKSRWRRTRSNPRLR